VHFGAIVVLCSDGGRVWGLGCWGWGVGLAQWDFVAVIIQVCAFRRIKLQILEVYFWGGSASILSPDFHLSMLDG